MTRRRSRTGPRPGGPLAMTKEARAIIRSDMPEKVRQYVFVATKTVLHGRDRTCLLCREKGLLCRVWVPGEALRVDQPVFRGITAYFVCGEHKALATDDPQILAALARRHTP